MRWKQRGEMDHFPDEIWQKIFSRLPVASLIRARTICKRWKGIVDSEVFKAIYSQEPPQDSYLLVSAYHYNEITDVSAFSVEEKKWYLIPFSGASGSLVPWRMICSAGAFIVVENSTEGLAVWNIISRTYKILRPSLPYSRVLAIVVVNNGHYKVLVVTHVGRAQVYDSETNSWEILVEVLNGVSRYYKNSAYLNGRLYMFAGIRYLISIDIHGGRNPVQVCMPDGLFEPFIMEHEGSLLLGGGVTENWDLRSINIWRLDQLEMKWHTVCSMPNNLLKGFQKPKDIFLRIIGSRGKICFFKRKCTSRPCMFDLYLGKWVKELPSAPYRRGRGVTVHWIHLAIEPRLYMELQ